MRSTCSGTETVLYRRPARGNIGGMVRMVRTMVRLAQTPE
jgi:hypothetical protein